MEKMNGESKDIVAENIDKIKELFPEVFTENKIDFERLQEILGEYVEDKDERYRFEWHGKSKAIKLAQTPSTGTLRPCKEESKNWDTTENLYIEGDNLEVLKLLQKTYNNSIKMIYIDPPYNTGKDFVYKDNFRDNIKNYLELTGQTDEGKKTSTNSESNGRFHTDWLNMIYPRLRLARNILANDGVIFISIDNNEIINMKLVCNEIFGEDNFIECITWNKRIPKNDKGVGNIHEYILVYSKSTVFRHELVMKKEGINEINLLLSELKEKKVPIKEAEQMIRELYKEKGYDRGITLYNSLNANYELWGKINMSWPNGNTEGPRYTVLHPITKQPVNIPDRGWRWKEDTFNEAVDYENIKICSDGTYLCGRIWFGKNENMQPSSVKYLREVEYMLLRSVISLKSDGGIEVERIFNNKNIFSYPKPTKLISKFIYSVQDKNAVIMDFFSGSASTGEAVMELNSRDGGKRKFVMVQLPEPIENKGSDFKNICEVAKERIRRSGDKILEDNKEKEDIEDLDIGFKVFKLDSSNLKKWNPDYDNLEVSLDDIVDNYVEGRTEEDVLYEIMLKFGIDLTYPIEIEEVNGKKVFVIGFGALFICLSDEIDSEIAEYIAMKKNELKPDITRVVFKDNGFVDDSAKTNIIQILKRNGIEEIMSV